MWIRYEDMLIVKLFLFQFVNTFFTIFFMAFLATRMDLLGEEVKCHLSCLEEVSFVEPLWFKLQLLNAGAVAHTVAACRESGGWQPH